MTSSLEALVAAAKVKANEVAVFEARPGKQWWLALVCTGLGLFGLPPLIAIVEWLSGGPAPDARTALSVVGALLIPIGILCAVNAIRGWPRLTITGHGVRFDTSLGSRWADWDSLSAFEIKTSYAGRFRKEFMSGIAAIVGANANKSWRTKKRFVIPDHFTMPIVDIVEKLNAERAAALGTASGESTTIFRPEPAVGLADFRIPWLTCALLLVLVLIFVAENIVTKVPGTAPLMAAAAVSRAAVLHGEWHRLFTAPLLHANVAHLIGNGVALLLGGLILERLVGRLWFFALYVAGGLGGSLMSIALNSPNVTSVGASGALMALFAALFTLSFHFPKGAARRQRLQLESLRILIPSLLPFLSAAGGHIDYAAHLGGALTGGILGGAMLRGWPDTVRIPGLRRMALGITLVGGVLVTVSAGVAAGSLPNYDVAMIPPNEVPKNAAEIQTRAATLAQRYPDDPRAHFYLGLALMNTQDYPAAERELRTALVRAEAAPGLRSEWQYELGVRTMLATVLSQEGKADEAKTVAKSVCVASSADERVQRLINAVRAQKLCD